MIEPEEGEREEEAPEQATIISTIKARLIEEQSKLITLMSAKKPEPSLIAMQQEMVNIVQKAMDNEEAAAKAKKVKKPKAPEPIKKALFQASPFASPSAFDMPLQQPSGRDSGALVQGYAEETTLVKTMPLVALHSDVEVDMLAKQLSTLDLEPNNSLYKMR